MLSIIRLLILISKKMCLLITEWLQWTILDIDVGGWLLDPDHPSDTFIQLLARFDMQPATSNTVVSIIVSLCKRSSTCMYILLMVHIN